MNVKKVPAKEVQLVQSVGRVKLSSPLTTTSQVVPRIKALLTAGVRHIFTVDFALGRFKTEMQAAGVPPATISRLLGENLDHHDGNNPGETATSVTLNRLGRGRLFGGNYVVLADQLIDHDVVCATFALLNPRLALAHRQVLVEISRYGDYLEQVSDEATRIALVLDAMIFGGKNQFIKPFYSLTDMQKVTLFNDLVKTMADLLTNIGQFRSIYESALANLRSETERATRDNLVRKVTDDISVTYDENILPSIAYQVSGAKVMIFVEILGKDSHGNDIFNYGAGLNPKAYSHNLGGLWERMRARENSERTKKGLSPLEPSNSWGGRENVGGSPKDRTIGSILTLDQVTGEIEAYLATQHLRT